MDSFAVTAMFVAASLFVFWLYILLPVGMASRRNRSALVWVLISLVVSPFVAVLLLLVLGDNR